MSIRGIDLIITERRKPAAPRLQSVDIDLSIDLVDIHALYDHVAGPSP
jgi:hypothetical protein